MRSTGLWLAMLGTLCLPSNVRSAENPGARAVVDRALAIAAPHVQSKLPIGLTSELPSGVSKNAEGWTLFDQHGTGERIFIYTRSAVFRCATTSHPSQDACLLKLASIIVHEAWHLRHGRDEACAYQAQLIFLQMKEASSFLQLSEAVAADIAATCLARNQVLAQERKQRSEAARRDEQLCQD